MQVLCNFASFGQHVFRAHPWGSIYEQFICFYRQIIGSWGFVIPRWPRNRLGESSSFFYSGGLVWVFREAVCSCFSLERWPVFITPGAEPVFLGVLGEGVVLAPSLLGQSREAQNTKHLLAMGSEKTSVQCCCHPSLHPSPFIGSSFTHRLGQQLPRLKGRIPGPYCFFILTPSLGRWIVQKGSHAVLSHSHKALELTYQRSTTRRMY